MEWRIHATSLVIRDTPSIKGKKLGEIKRGELVKVTKGFVFGGFLQDKSYPLVP